MSSGTGGERVVVELSDGSFWEQLVGNTMPALLGAIAAVLVVYLTARTQQRANELQFRKTLRLDLYRRALVASQDKLHLLMALSDAGSKEVATQLRQQLSPALRDLRAVAAESDALASQAFARALRALVNFGPHTPAAASSAATELEFSQAYRERAQQLFDDLSAVVQAEFGLSSAGTKLTLRTSKATPPPGHPPVA